jgi:hypothetical protein
MPSIQTRLARDVRGFVSAVAVLLVSCVGIPALADGGLTCATATPVGPGSYDVDTTDQSAFPGPCGHYPKWFRFYATADGDVNANTCAGGNFDTMVGAFFGPGCGNLEYAACSDDACSYLSSITFHVTAGRWYWLTVGGYGSNRGQATLTLSGPVSGSGPADCDGNGIDDATEIANGTAADCDHDGMIDSCAISGGLVADCDRNGVPDVCQIADGSGHDCNPNGILDSCEIAGGAPDCNSNGVPDSCEIAGGAPDCNGNGVPDSCEIANGAADCNHNGVPDSCDIANGTAADCNHDGIPDRIKLSCQL